MSPTHSSAGGGALAQLFAGRGCRAALFARLAAACAAFQLTGKAFDKLYSRVE
ncbi:hypothetical protein [Sphaerisporangium dianthi]|uniref:Uncharacterized protein n=1 Tax=Sphaerisporangium dianthi TaxID=1436120 RepID=A0ABV9CP60_9ACTN